MITQPALFDACEYIRHPCPCCRSGDVVAVDLDMVGQCRACGATLWRDDEGSPWERMSQFFGQPTGKATTRRERIKR